MSASPLAHPFEADTEFSAQTFKRLALHSQSVDRKEFDGCTFNRCSFTETAFNNCKFRDCTFKDCTLRLVGVKGSVFNDVRFESTQITGVNWTDGAWSKGGLLNAISFAECDLSYCLFIGLSLKKLKLIKCAVKNCDFAEADLTLAVCTDSDFAETRFLHTNLTEADFSAARNYAISPTVNTLKKTKFSLPNAIALLYALDIVIVD